MPPTFSSKAIQKRFVLLSVLGQPGCSPEFVCYKISDMPKRLKKSKRKLALRPGRRKVKHMDIVTSFPNAIWREGDYYVARRLDVDISSIGRTRRAALKNLEEALEDYFFGKLLRAAEKEKPLSWKEAKKLLK